MDTPFLNPNPQLLLALAASHRFSEPFTVFDVGASGGISPVWYAFGDALIAYGFDPLRNEVDRLNKLAPAIGRTEYVDAFVVRSSDSEEVDAIEKQDCVFPRSSAARSLQITGTDFTKEVFNAGAELRYTTNRFSIDEFAAARNITCVDFIKVDTDGNDYSVLLGARATLETAGVLGVAVEVAFNTEPHPEAGLFSHHDGLLHSLGFELFDLDVRRYTRAALPGKFRHNIPAQTLTGQIDQGDAIYLRDFADPAFKAAQNGMVPSLGKLLKMVSLFEIFGLNDCAVELIFAYEREFSKVFDLEQLVSMLAEEFSGTADYQAYIASFEKHVRERRYAAFPDGYEVRAEGYVVAPKGNTAAPVFKQR